MQRRHRTHCVRVCACALIFWVHADDGCLSIQEFRDYFADGVMSTAQLNELFADIDTDKSGNIDTTELAGTSTCPRARMPTDCVTRVAPICIVLIATHL